MLMIFPGRAKTSREGRGHGAASADPSARSAACRPRRPVAVRSWLALWAAPTWGSAGPDVRISPRHPAVGTVVFVEQSSDDAGGLRGDEAHETCGCEIE